MDIQTMLDNAVQSARSERLKTSPQLSLGELIAKLEPMMINNDKVKEKYKDEITVEFDFEYAVPTGLGSWRGSYSELAINFDFLGYEHFGKEEPKAMHLSKFLEMLKGAIGKEYQGWKGGEFVMGKNTPLWVANDGNSGNTGVIGIKDNEYSVTLLTGLCEY